MDDIYQWLYDHYALPELEPLLTGQDEMLARMAERLRLPKRERRRMLDMAENMRLQWGTEAFALGVRVGRELAAPRVPSADCGWLMHFLP